MQRSVASPSVSESLLPALPRQVVLREVGPRDGLQGERPLPPEERARLSLSLIEAGCRRVEVASFVSPKAVPAMAGGAEVVRKVKSALPPESGVTLTALVPNLRGAAEAIEAGVDELTVTVSVSPTYNERNVRMTVDQSVEEVERIAKMADSSGVPLDAVVSCAFGSPYETGITPEDVTELALRLLEKGASALTFADTTGVAVPPVLEDVLGAFESADPDIVPGLHLHETRGTALVNAFAALQLGISRFDCSVGGLGGSPFAAGAGGNLATEDFVSFLDLLGVSTGIDLGRMLQVAEALAPLVGRELPSKVRTPLGAAAPAAR